MIYHKRLLTKNFNEFTVSTNKTNKNFLNLLQSLLNLPQPSANLLKSSPNLARRFAMVPPNLP
jgi:hypothetical protein